MSTSSQLVHNFFPARARASEFIRVEKYVRTRPDDDNSFPQILSTNDARVYRAANSIGVYHDGRTRELGRLYREMG